MARAKSGGNGRLEEALTTLSQSMVIEPRAGDPGANASGVTQLRFAELESFFQERQGKV
jgi:hypothetical protein